MPPADCGRDRCFSGKKGKTKYWESDESRRKRGRQLLDTDDRGFKGGRYRAMGKDFVRGYL
jgi:hypothetical protein